MGKIRIVIEIPESIYKKAQDGELSEFDSCYINGAVADGKPLPEGHGDLKDANRLLDGFYEYCKNGDFGYHQAEDLIKSSLTIVEAEEG